MNPYSIILTNCTRVLNFGDIFDFGRFDGSVQHFQSISSVALWFLLLVPGRQSLWSCFTDKRCFFHRAHGKATPSVALHVVAAARYIFFVSPRNALPRVRDSRICLLMQNSIGADTVAPQTLRKDSLREAQSMNGRDTLLFLDSELLGVSLCTAGYASVS